MKRLFTALLALALLVLPAAPALAAEFEELDPPLWQALYCNSREEYMEQSNLSAEEYMDQIRWMRDYLAAHPEQDRDFDADSYYVDVFSSDPIYTKESWINHRVHDYPYRPYGEAEFRAEMKAHWLLGLWRNHKDELHRDALASLYPEDFAAFDADAWFSAYDDGRPTQESKPEYMARNALDGEEAFRRSMFALCCDGTYFADGIAVALDGVPMNFSANGGSRPQRSGGGPSWLDIEEIPMVPARTFCEALGCTVTYEADTGSVTLSKAGHTAVFTLGSEDYTIDGAALTLAVDSKGTTGCSGAISAVEGRTYLPLPVLAEFLGLDWAWNGPRSAAFLQTKDKD